MASRSLPHRPVGVGQVAPGGQRVGVVRAEHPLPVGQGLDVQRHGVLGPPGRVQRGGQAAPGGGGHRVVLAQDQLLVGQRPPVHGDRVGQSPGGPVGAGQVAAGGQRLGVIGAEHPLPPGQGPLEVRQRLLGPVRGQAGPGQVAARGQRVRVAGAERLLALAQRVGQHADGQVGAPGHLIGGGQALHALVHERGRRLPRVAAGQVPPRGRWPRSPSASRRWPGRSAGPRPGSARPGSAAGDRGPGST